MVRRVILEQGRGTLAARVGQRQGRLRGCFGFEDSAAVEKRTGEKIDGDLTVVFGGRSEPGQIGCAFVFASGIQATETDDQIAQSGEVFGCMTGPSGRAILAEGHIADVVERVFDGPVAAAKRLELSSVHFSGRAAGEEDFHFFGNVPGLEMMGGASEHRGLDGVRESRALRSDFERIDRPGLMPAVALVQSDVRREKKRRSRPWRAWRAFQRAWVDWL